MPDTTARSYKLRETGVAGDPDHPINPIDGLGQTLWAELDRDCGGSAPELQTGQFGELQAVPQQGDDTDPTKWAAKYASDAAEVRPVLAELHIKDMLLTRLPPSLKPWADAQRTRRSERAGHTDEQCTLQEVLQWLGIKCRSDKTSPWHNRKAPAAPAAALLAQQGYMAFEHPLPAQGPTVPPHLAGGCSHAWSNSAQGGGGGVDMSTRCYRCGGWGHVATQCGTPAPAGGGGSKGNPGGKGGGSGKGRFSGRGGSKGGQRRNASYLAQQALMAYQWTEDANGEWWSDGHTWDDWHGWEMQNYATPDSATQNPISSPNSTNQIRKVI